MDEGISVSSRLPLGWFALTFLLSIFSLLPMLTPVIICGIPDILHDLIQRC